MNHRFFESLMYNGSFELLLHKLRVPLVDHRLFYLVDHFLVLLVDYWLMNFSDFFLVNNRLMMFMDDILVLLMNNVFVMFMNNILMVLMDYISVVFSDNGLSDVRLDFRWENIFLNDSWGCMAFKDSLFFMSYNCGCLIISSFYNSFALTGE